VRLLVAVNIKMIFDCMNLVERESCMEEGPWSSCRKEEDLEEGVVFIGVDNWGMLLDFML
jgi:hypothetical protein